MTWDKVIALQKRIDELESRNFYLERRVSHLSGERDGLQKKLELAVSTIRDLEKTLKPFIKGESK